MQVVESFFNIYCQRLTKLVCVMIWSVRRFIFFRVPDTADES